MYGHWAFDKDVGKFWLPGDYCCIYTEGICNCRIVAIERRKKEKKLQIENDPEYKARKQNEELWKENARLIRIIEKLTNRKLK
jgi:hypothetical protein